MIGLYNVLRDPFCNHHSHFEGSNIRLKDSTNKFADVFKYVANELGQTHVTITDHEFVGGHLKALNTLDTLKGKGAIPDSFTVGLGNEIYLVDESEMRDKLSKKEYVNFYHFLLIALDSEGHKQLRELSTRAWGRMFNHKKLDRVPTFKSDLEGIVKVNQGHIVATTACLGGELSKSILSGNEDRAEQFIAWCQDVFGEDNFFLEMQPHNERTPLETEENVEDVDLLMTHEQAIVNSWIAKRGLPTTIATDAHYLKKESRKLHESYLRSDESEEALASGGRELGEFYATTYFMGIDELRDKLFYLDDIKEGFFSECIQNTYKIKTRIKGYNLKMNQIIPEIPLPPKNTWSWNQDIVDYIEDLGLEHILHHFDSDNEYDQYLMSLCMKGMEERKIPKYEWKETLERLDTEMKELIGISKAKSSVMSSYFVTMNKMIDIFWEDAQAIVGASRGSSAGWMTNYLLGIVQINPLKQPVEMFHWRSTIIGCKMW